VYSERTREEPRTQRNQRYLLEDSASDANISGEGALFVDESSLDGALGSLET